MAGLFDALGTATRGLQVVQRGIATTGHNIANVNTPNYSRQRSVLQTSEPQTFPNGTIGSGVEQVTIERIVDRFVALRLVSETTRQAGLATESSIYEQIESVVNDQLEGGLSSELTRFFGSLDELANSTEPGQAVARGQVLSAAESLVGTVHRWDSQLRGLQRDADRGVTGLLPEINSLTAEIASLNEQIVQAEAIAPANDLRDRRDGLILELATKVEISYLDDSDGTTSIRIKGGLPLVDKSLAAELVAVVDPLNPNASDPTFSQVFFQGSNTFFDVTSSIQGGELGGLLDARDKTIAQAIGDLDAFVFSLADEFNTAHRQGLGLVDDGVYDFFEDLGTQPTTDGAAQNLRISSDIDPGQGGSLDNIAAGLRAGTPPGLPAAPGDLGNVDLLKDVRTTRVPLYLAGDVPGTPTGSTALISSSLLNMVGEIGQNALSTSRALEQQEAILASVQDRRDSISSVSMDEEVAGLVQLQASFQANARVISAVQSMMDALFNAF